MFWREVLALHPRVDAVVVNAGIHLETPFDGPDEVWDAADSQGLAELQWQRYGIESYVCLRLIRACEHSMVHKAAVVFC